MQVSERVHGEIIDFTLLSTDLLQEKLRKRDISCVSNRDKALESFFALFWKQFYAFRSTDKWKIIRARSRITSMFAEASVFWDIGQFGDAKDFIERFQICIPNAFKLWLRSRGLVCKPKLIRAHVNMYTRPCIHVFGSQRDNVCVPLKMIELAMFVYRENR